VSSTLLLPSSSSFSSSIATEVSAEGGLVRVAVGIPVVASTVVSASSVVSIISQQPNRAPDVVGQQSPDNPEHAELALHAAAAVDSGSSISTSIIFPLFPVSIKAPPPSLS